MIPLSEETQIMSAEKIVVESGGQVFRTFGFELKPGEVTESSVHIELHEGASCEINIFIRGEGELRVRRTVKVLGNEAKLSLRSSGEAEGNARIYLSDDVLVLGQESKVDIRTKIVLKEEARSEARQRIVLQPSAKAANVSQRIDHLLLGDKSQAEGIPELDVHLDDVTCTHAATTSRPSPEMLFYLSSRGLKKEEAEKMIVHGFLGV